VNQKEHWHVTDFQTVLAQALAMAAVAVGLVKPLVDTLKMALPTVSGKLLPIAALAMGVVVTSLLGVASGSTVTVQMAAIAVLAGLFAGLGAIGVHELGQHADAHRSRIAGAEHVRILESVVKSITPPPAEE
jgi:hypothetical protein